VGAAVGCTRDAANFENRNSEQCESFISTTNYGNEKGADKKSEVISIDRGVRRRGSAFGGKLGLVAGGWDTKRVEAVNRTAAQKFITVVAPKDGH